MGINLRVKSLQIRDTLTVKMNRKRVRLARVSCFKAVIRKVLRKCFKLRLIQKHQVVVAAKLRQVSLKVVVIWSIVIISHNSVQLSSTTIRSWQILRTSKSNRLVNNIKVLTTTARVKLHTLITISKQTTNLSRM